MRIRSLLILASAFAILCSAIPILSNANSSTENNQNLSNSPMANNKLPKTETRPQERPRKRITAEEKAARIVKIQQWEAGMKMRNNANWERYQEGIKRARKEAFDMGKDLDDAALNYSWNKLQVSGQLLRKRIKKKKGNLITGKKLGRPRIVIDPAEMAAWEAERKGQRGWTRHLDALKKAEDKAIRDGKNAEEVKEVVARKRDAAFLEWRKRREAGLGKKKDINDSGSVAVQSEPAGHLQNEEDPALSGKTGEMPISFDFESDLVSSDEEDGGPTDSHN